MRFSDDEMWKAVVECNKEYDGSFFYSVKTVGAFCHPSCKSRTPLRKNVCYFETVQQAIEAGLRPCKRCRPDLADYEPIFEIAKQTKALIDEYYSEKARLAAKMKQLHITQSHLAVIFKRQYGMPPIQYINKLREEHAKHMLLNTDTPIIDIAGDIGFDSLSAFYTFFKKRVGTTPKKYRISAGNIEFMHLPTVGDNK